MSPRAPAANKSPLQRIVGFEVAEEIYDKLTLLEQIILDLKIVGWTESDIAICLGISQSWVNIVMHKARFKLADTKLYHILKMRQLYKETATIVTTIESYEEEA